MLTATQIESPRARAEYNLGYVWLISIIAAMGGLLFGWDWVVIGGAKPFFQRYFQLTSEAQIGWANSCALVGCLAGALVAGHLAVLHCGRLAGYRKSGDADVEELRSFYFQTTGELDETPQVALGRWR